MVLLFGDQQIGRFRERERLAGPDPRRFPRSTRVRGTVSTSESKHRVVVRAFEWSCCALPCGMCTFCSTTLPEMSQSIGHAHPLLLESWSRGVPGGRAGTPGCMARVLVRQADVLEATHQSWRIRRPGAPAGFLTPAMTRSRCCGWCCCGCCCCVRSLLRRFRRDRTNAEDSAFARTRSIRP